MNDEEIKTIFERTGAILTGSHFVYRSGQHGHTYVNKDNVYVLPHLISRLCRGIAQAFTQEKIEVVVAPAVGGVVLSQWVTYHLENCAFVRNPMAVFADKDGEGFALRRGYDKLVAGKRVLVVEDILTTGGSVMKVVAEVRRCGGKVAGVGALVNRGGVSEKALGVPKLFALMNITLDMWPAGECPLCAKGVPVNTAVGHGRGFLERQTAQATA